MSDEVSILKRKQMATLKRQLQSQHAVHGVYATVFDLMGGIDAFLEWGLKNPTKFYTMLPKFAPSMVPTQGMIGDVSITVHTDLQRSPLDDLDAEYDAVDEVVEAEIVDE